VVPDEGDQVLAKVVGRIPVEHLARSQTAFSTVASDLKSILKNKLKDGPNNATTKETMVDARIGQGAFRSQVLAIWNSQCCVTGSTTLDAIRASHIRPWRDSNSKQRLDPNNGLPLVATLDALFDAGLITFSSDGKLLVSRKVDDNEKETLRLVGLHLKRKSNAQTAEYLSYHRETIFIGRGE